MSDIKASPVLAVEQKMAIHAAFELQVKHQWKVAQRSASERIVRLRKLHDALLRYRDEINAAMWADFGKPPEEVVITEMGVVNSEIRHAIRHLRSWMRPKRVGTPLFLFGTWSKVYYQPKGVCLIISPWNFPFNLTLAPLVSAIAAGNCAILKPSEFTPHSSALMKKILAGCFPPEEVEVFEGDALVSQELTSLPFNHIFFTGSPAVGKIVMKAAAANLSSITLELGGKSPVVVDEGANLDNAAAKIIWLKCMNAGQICISPDYVLVHERAHDELVNKLGAKIREFYGETPELRQKSPDYCRIVNARHFDRVKGLLDDALARGAKTMAGGATDAADRFIDPAVLTGIPPEARIWSEEIFGPLIPVRSYKTIDEALAFINERPNPLSMYLFSNRKETIDKLQAGTRAGGGAINDCGLHFYQPNLPFGGVNNSGIGHCHGKAGFLEFSNQRGITRQNTLYAHTNLFVPPYGKNKLAKWLLEAVLKWL